jgi:hypothetical protein
MAWRNTGSFYLGPNQSGRYWVGWPAPGDKGPQWIMAHASRGQQPTELVVTDHSKKLDYSIAWVRSDGTRGYHYDSLYYQYLVTVTNRGSSGVTFSLEGGGV